MKSIDALRALQELPTSEKWFTLYFDVYANASQFCKGVLGEKAVIGERCALNGHMVLITSVPLYNWCEDAPAYDAVMIDPDGFKLNALYVYMLEE